MFRVTFFAPNLYDVVNEKYFNNIQEAKSACTGDCNLCVQYRDSRGRLRYRLVGFSSHGVYVSKVY